MLIRKIIVTIASLTVITAHADQIIVSAVGHDILSGCHADHHCELKGIHDIQITNTENKPHSYKYIYNLCTIKQGLRADCDHAVNTIEVPAYSTWNNHRDSKTNPYFALATGYGYIVETQVMGYQPAIIENKYQIKVKP